jgi:hypothetical protein
VLRATVNGVRVTPSYTLESWGRSGTKLGAMTFRSLGFSLAKVKAFGFSLCLTMATSRTCGTPAGLCYGSGSCTYSLLDETFKCCPVSTVTTQYS